MPVRVIEGVAQHFDWGDPSFIPDLLGVASRGKPWAEYWLGTHESGPSVLDDGTPLVAITGELPYLLKILAAAQPLSLQTHPTPEQAAEGHGGGVFIDPNAKPELLVALTDVEAFCGFRPRDRTLELLGTIGAHSLAAHVEEHDIGPTAEALYRGHIDPADTIGACATSSTAEASWVRELEARYPGDRSVAVTLLLNHVVLRPGDALHLPAGNLHAYLRGAGIEVMGNSDNTVRGGLTSKHVDIELLLDIVDPTPLDDPVMTVTNGHYPLPEVGVVLQRLDPGDSHTSTGHEIAVALDGTTLYLSPGTQVFADSTTFVVTS